MPRFLSFLWLCPLIFLTSSHSACLLPRNQICRTAMAAPSSLPQLRLGRRMSPLWDCPWPFALAWSAHLSCLLTWEGPICDCGHALTAISLYRSLMPLCRKARATPRLPDRPGIIYLLRHPPHLSLLLPTVWNWRTSVSSGCDASFFHVVNSELSRWRSQAALLLCNSHLTPECSTSVKAMDAKLFFSDSLLTTPTGWWRAWSSSRVAGHLSHHSSTAMPGAHYPRASAPLKSAPHSWVGAKHNNGNQGWWNLKPVQDRVWVQGKI